MPAAVPVQGKPFVRQLLGRSDFAIISDIVEPGTQVLDLGCGDGELLEWLAENKGVEARGVLGVAAAIVGGPMTMIMAVAGRKRMPACSGE